MGFIMAIRSNEVFVFGSNIAGRHGKGAALTAKLNYGARQGQGVGLQGRSYAIPTKDAALRDLPLPAIDQHIGDFIKFAEEHPELSFYVTPVGCGLRGLKQEVVLPLFKGMPSNCRFAETWDHVESFNPAKNSPETAAQMAALFAQKGTPEQQREALDWLHNEPGEHQVVIDAINGVSDDE
jgi:hypothetical protein